MRLRAGRERFGTKHTMTAVRKMMTRAGRAGTEGIKRRQRYAPGRVSGMEKDGWKVAMFD